MHERDILLAALDLVRPEEREAYLAQACGEDHELRRRVDALLRAAQVQDSFLESPPAGGGSPTIVQPHLEEPGAQIGPYKLLQQIGEGGMGVVYMAEQTEPVKRRVALKIIKPGMDTRQVIARFEAERQALSLMDHPNIARVLDAGATESGRPYFVMELVRGTPITQYCDENSLPVRERLELFVSVCQAIQHAHSKGIIHRDIKPTNVLVTRQDGQNVVKVIDFGVAKAMGQQLTEKTLFTEFAQMIGTPLYMSPEQAELSSVDIDTRSDIYSLGVLLYELLTGSTPVSREQLKQAAVDEVRRIIREDEPQKPSTRISTAQAAPSIAAQRHTEPSKLARLVRGELDWIVMKALEKDRNRRYETANGFERDVQRYLNDEPVRACPPSACYRLRKFVTRNKGLVLGAALVLLALVAGIIGTSCGVIRAEQARRDAVSAQAAEAKRAERERRAKEEAQKRLVQIEKGTEILASVFRDLDPMAAENEGVTLRDLLCRRLAEASQQLEGETVGDPLIVARLQLLLGISLREMGHLEQAELVLVKACQTRERLLRVDHLDTVATKHHLAMLYREQGKFAPAEALYQEVLAVRTARLGAEHVETAATKHHLAMLFASQGKYGPAEALLKEVLAIRTARLGADHRDTLTTQHRLAVTYRSQAKFELSETLHKEVLATRTDKLGSDHLDTVATKNSLAALYHTQGKLALAEPLYNEVLAVRTAKLGAEHPDTLNCRGHLASLYLFQDKFPLAEALFKEVLAVRTAKLGADHPATLGTRQELACLYDWQKKYPLAESLYKENLEVGTAKLGTNHPIIISSRHKLGMLYWSQWKLDLAVPMLEEAFQRTKANLRHDHPTVLAMQADLGIIYCAAGRFADAVPLLEEVQQKGRENPDHSPVRSALLTAYVRTGKKTETTALLTEQVRAAREQFPADSPELAAALSVTGRALLEAQAYADAEPLLRESMSLGEKQAPDAWNTHHVRSLLGAALMGQQKYVQAEPLLKQAYAGLKERAAEIPLEERGSVTTALERLVQLYDAWGKSDEAAKWSTELEKAKVKP